MLWSTNHDQPSVFRPWGMQRLEPNNKSWNSRLLIVCLPISFSKVFFYFKLILYCVSCLFFWFLYDPFIQIHIIFHLSDTYILLMLQMFLTISDHWNIHILWQFVFLYHHVFICTLSFTFLLTLSSLISSWKQSTIIHRNYLVRFIK